VGTFKPIAALSGLVLALILVAPPWRVRAPEDSSAIHVLRTIYAAQIQYQSTFNKFAATLDQLGPPLATGQTEGPEAAGLIPHSLASGEASGYLFAVTGTAKGFTVVAVPKTFGKTGRRTFYMDQSGIIRQNWGREPATLNSPEAGSLK